MGLEIGDPHFALKHLFCPKSPHAHLESSAHPSTATPISFSQLETIELEL